MTRVQLAHHLVGRRTLPARLERDVEHGPDCRRRPPPPTFDVNDATFVSFASLRRHDAREPQHLDERRALRRFGGRVERARVVGRKQALGNDGPQHRRSATRISAENTSVNGRCRMTQPRLRSYAAQRASNMRSVKLNNRPCFSFVLCGLSNRLHSIGVSVSETSPDTRIATADRDGELAEQPADDAAHEHQRNEHRRERQTHRENREADFLARRRAPPGAATFPSRRGARCSRASRSRRRRRSRRRA